MNYLDRVQSGIDIIENNLHGDIRVADVAKHAGISQWHFQRIFKALTNETLKTYIRSRRLAIALDKLVCSDIRVLDIALESGFQSQESFTRAFKQAFGVTPAEHRKRGRKFQFLRKAKFDSDYLLHLHNNISLEPEIYDQPALTLVGLRTRFYSVDSEKNNIARKLPPLWQRFLARLDSVPARVGNHCYGVVQQTAMNTDQLEYLAVAESADEHLLPRGMVRMRLPAARYAKFKHVGPTAGLDRTVSYVYSSWLARSGMRHAGGADLEFYGPEYAEQADHSVVYYAIPVAEG